MSKPIFAKGVLCLTIVALSLALPSESFAQCTTDFDNADEFATLSADLLFFQAMSHTAPSVLSIELWYALGGPTQPGIYRIEDDPANANYQTCHTCVLIVDFSDPVERFFFAQSGELNITSIGPVGVSLTGTLANADLVEVTIDPMTYLSTPVPGGETRCIDILRFDTPITGDGPSVDSDGDGLSDDEELILGTDPLNPDTDGGGVSDGQEVHVDGTDPLDPSDDLLPIDQDGDGFPVGVDCDDGDPSINPDATEIWYDGIDQNCDGADDFDQDGDGYPVDQDCDDTNFLASPGLQEMCDGFDNNCDGLIDDMGPCIAVHLRWQTPGDTDETDRLGTDLDLHLLHPNGDWFDPVWDCHWQNRQPNWGDPSSPLDDPALLIDDVDGAGPEIISLEVPEPGAVYQIGVDYFSDHQYGPSYASVKVFVDGQMTFEETGRRLSVKEFWEVATIDGDTRAVTAIGVVRPAAIGDLAATTVNTPIAIDVLGNDTDPDGDPLFINSFDASSEYGGTVSCDATVTSPTPQCTYTPPTSFIGADSFTYDATDGSSVSFRAVVTITVGPEPGQCLEFDPPVPLFFGDVEVGSSSEEVVVFLNCGSVELTIQSVEIFDDPPGAYSIVIAPPLPVTLYPGDHDGVLIVYVPPDAGFHVATLEIQTDIGSFSQSLSGSGTPPLNEPPHPFDDATMTPTDTPIGIDVLANDEDPDGDPLFVNFFEPFSANGGTVQCDTTISTPVPQCTYTPAAGFTGTDMFVYDVTDGDLVSLDPAVVTIEVFTGRSPEWTALYNGPGDDLDRAFAIAVDEAGNTYVAGESAGVAAGSDFVTISYDPDGVQRWVQRYDGPTGGDDYATAIAIGPSGNVYGTGDSLGDAGFDIATVAYDVNGNELWTARYDGPAGGPDHTTIQGGSSGIGIDADENVTVTGRSWGGDTGYDFVTVSYDSAGNERWAARYNGPRNEHDGASSVAVDADGNVYVTGLSDFPESESYLFFPGYLVAQVAGDYATVAYDSVGNQLWAALYDGDCSDVCPCGDNARSVGVGPAGLVFVTGTSRSAVPPGECASSWSTDLATVAYDRQGQEVWVSRYAAQPGGIASGGGLAVDGFGNVAVAGYLEDPWVDGEEFLTVSYDSTGIERWTVRSGFEGFRAESRAIAADPFGHVYISGLIRFGLYLSDSDIMTIALDPAGNELWTGVVDGPANLWDGPFDMAVDRSGNVFVAGSSGSYVDPFGDSDYSQTDVITIRYSSDDADGDGIPDHGDACPAEDARGFDVDGNGCVDSFSGLQDLLVFLVDQGKISPELKVSLQSKITNAESLADAGSLGAAVNILGALINDVEAQRGKKISDEAADQLVGYTNSLIAWLLSQG